MGASGDCDRTRTTTRSQTVRAQLEITPSEDAIRGRLTVEGEESSDFYGWLELINLLEGTRTASAAGP